MMDGTVKQILESKGSAVTVVEPGVTLLDCAIMMRDQGIGSLLIVKEEALLGILHERDICRRAVCESMDLSKTPVATIMDSEFAIISSRTSIMDAMAIISTQRVRHLPVIDDDNIVGLISIRDLTKWVLDLQQEDIDHLVQYITGSNTTDFSYHIHHGDDNLF